MTSEQQHRLKYLNDLRLADYFLGLHLGPRTLIRRELAIIIAEVEKENPNGKLETIIAEIPLDSVQRRDK